jgi:predicted HTH transcriptional regulator
MVNEIKKNSELILKYLSKNKNITISDLERKLPISRCQIRVSLPFLLGAEKINEFKMGMCKVYNIK